jgi:hypothetical protein
MRKTTLGEGRLAVSTGTGKGEIEQNSTQSKISVVQQKAA